MEQPKEDKATQEQIEIKIDKIMDQIVILQNKIITLEEDFENTRYK